MISVTRGLLMDSCASIFYSSSDSTCELFLVSDCCLALATSCSIFVLSLRHLDLSSSKLIWYISCYLFISASWSSSFTFRMSMSLFFSSMSWFFRDSDCFCSDLASSTRPSYLICSWRASCICLFRYSVSCSNSLMRFFFCSKLFESCLPWIMVARSHW